MLEKQFARKMQKLTYSGSLAKECISFINKKQQPGAMWADIIYLLFINIYLCIFSFIYLLKSKYNIKHGVTYPRRLVFAQSNTLCMAVTPSRPMGATSPPVMIA